MTMNEVYGTPPYYQEQFADFIADAQHDAPQFGDNLIAGFKLAIDDWRQYHIKQVEEMNRIEALLDDKSGIQKSTY